MQTRIHKDRWKVKHTAVNQMKPNQRPKQKQNPCSGGRTIWVGHLLHSSGGDHDGHGDLEPQHGGGHVDLGHVDQYTRTEP